MRRWDRWMTVAGVTGVVVAAACGGASKSDLVEVADALGTVEVAVVSAPREAGERAAAAEPGPDAGEGARARTVRDADAPAVARGDALTEADEGEAPPTPPPSEPVDGSALFDALQAKRVGTTGARGTALLEAPPPRARPEPEPDVAEELVAMGYLEGATGSASGVAYGGGGHALRGAVAAEVAAGAPAKSARMLDDDGVADARSVSEGAPRPPVAPRLRAASTDDNADYKAFLDFLGTWTDRPGMAGTYVPLDVRDRGYVSVTDAAGVALPDASVALIADGVRVHAATTLRDGRAPLFPRLARTGVAPRPAGRWNVSVSHGGVSRTVPWDGTSDLDVRLDVPSRADGPVPVDVAIVLDTTGSMADEIDRIKATLLTVTSRLGELGRPVDLRLGAVHYRDRGDDYVTREVPFTADVRAFDRALRALSAGGGGDTPESLNQAVVEAVRDLSWRPQAARVAFLIADAPPHMDYAGESTYADAAIEALARGIRVHSVAASGLDSTGSLIFRQLAQLTQGEFVFIQYGSAAAIARSHGVANAEQVQSNDLDEILYRRIRAEVDGWRR